MKTHSLPTFQAKGTAKPSGFALVATLMLMLLLGLLAIGMLSLSSISLRSASQISALSEARGNARMALMLAIGELQKQMGPDQRISANAEILDDPSTPSNEVQHPNWTGVWNSWKAGGSSTDSVDGFSAHSTIEGVSATGIKPTYTTNRADHFRSWLLSLNPQEAADIASATTLTLADNQNPDPYFYPDKNTDAVWLVRDGSLGKATAKRVDYVSARLLSVKSPTGTTPSGRYAWWVGDESQKAMIMDDSYAAQSTLTSAEKIFRGQAPASTGTKTVKGLENISNDKQLDALPTLSTLDLVKDVAGRPAQENFHNITTTSHGVLADVREGGLKRDLSTLLERPIITTESGSEYILYEFDDARFPGNRTHSRVPIQDLAAYYQLYDDDPSWTRTRRGGVKYNSTQLANAIQAATPDYGTATTKTKFLRQYTGLYENPVPIKVQFLLGFKAELITATERAWINANQPDPTKQLKLTDTHKLRLVVMPVVTLWNPNSLPLLMGGDVNKAQVFRLNTPPFAFQLRKHSPGGLVHTNGYFNLNHAQGEGTGDGRATRLFPHVIQFRFGRTAPIAFKPGEVKMFSVPASTTGYTVTILEPINAWDPYGFYTMPNSALESNPNSFVYTNPNYQKWIVFNTNDSIDVEFNTESVSNNGRNVSPMNETYGGGFNFYLLDNNYEPYSVATHQNHLRNYQFMSRFGGGTALGQGPNAAFNAELMTQGFPGQTAPIPFDGPINAIPGTTLVGASNTSEVVAFAEFALMAGCEISSQGAGGNGGGRRIATRPFLHGATIAPPFINRSDKASLYDFGWDWQINRINTVEDSLVQEDPGTGNGYYGGGYTLEAGATRVVQQEIPVAPPISLAAFSHAHLGGFSLANDATVGESSASLHWKSGEIRDPAADGFQRVTATGQGGLAPHIMQAIGNSYAHPNISADKAFITSSRLFDSDTGAKVVPFVDHSYLANKALWDDYFFSSISPQLSAVKVFESASDRTAKQVADDFFFSKMPLPNRRMATYSTGLDKTKFEAMFTSAEQQMFTGGLGDKIAAHLMVEGPFNINSTSVEAWKVLLSSIKGKPVSYLDGAQPSEVSRAGTAVGFGMLPNGAPIASADITSPNQPAAQWNSWRELSDTEIGELATAIVNQVKLRGPFLSLSEFVNRRLGGSNTQLALKGALQAALDDNNVSINANFRTSERTLDSQVAGIGFAFSDAAKGPVAYGSSAYVDQADVLRNLAEQLTPRGDTFVIRTYGDSLDSEGNVRARAWCEAVVQRVPEYVDPADPSHAKQSALTSASNQSYGRKFEIVTFRWLNSNEV